MTRILFIGQKPETVDFSDPSLPPGFNAEKINAGIAVGIAKIEGRGWKGDTCMITPDAAGSAMLEKALKSAGTPKLPPAETLHDGTDFKRIVADLTSEKRKRNFAFPLLRPPIVAVAILLTAETGTMLSLSLERTSGARVPGDAV
jgi:hypothetical protein